MFPYTMKPENIAHYMNGVHGIAPECLKADTQVWKFTDDNHNSFVSKFMPRDKAQHHVRNAALYRLAGLPTVDCTAVSCDGLVDMIHNSTAISTSGIVLMPYLRGMVLEEYAAQFNRDDRMDFYRHIKEETLAACIITNHTDPHDQNIICLDDSYTLDPRDIGIRFIDTEYGLADTPARPVDQLYETLIESEKYHQPYPHYAVKNCNHERMIENAQSIVGNLCTAQEYDLYPDLNPHIPEMIERGTELVSVLRRKGPK